MKSGSRKAAGKRRATKRPLTPRETMSPVATIQESPPPGDDGEVGQSCPVDSGQKNRADLANLIGEIREQWRRRQSWHRAEKSLTSQAKALCRRLVLGDTMEAEALLKAALGKGTHDLSDIAFAATFPLIEARKTVETHRKLVEKRLAKLAAQLPVAEWVAGVRGFGIASLASIVGEAGNLSDYATVAKVWKRFGLAVMPSGRQRKVAGAEGIEHGYSPARRSVVWVIGESMMRTGGSYKAVYDARKIYEAPRVETKGHAHNRAKRYMEKRLLRDLWVAWRAATKQSVLTNGEVSRP
jgi:hypothetical protein